MVVFMRLKLDNLNDLLFSTVPDSYIITGHIKNNVRFNFKVGLCPEKSAMP